MDLVSRRLHRLEDRQRRQHVPPPPVAVTVKPGPKLVPAVTPCVSVTWVDDDSVLRRPALAPARGLDASAGSRLDLLVTVQGYATR
jgi:hypothetical protein